MNDERAMLMFARLTAVSFRRGQPIGRVRFLILAGIAAVRAGWPEVAVRCHELVTRVAPHHLLTKYSSIAAALRDTEFAAFAGQLRKFCTPERAEHLLTELGLPTAWCDANQTAGEAALELLMDV